MRNEKVKPKAIVFNKNGKKSKTKNLKINENITTWHLITEILEI